MRILKLDPNSACQNQKELLLWALLHDLIAHPFLAITGYSVVGRRFHNWTSKHAWPRGAGDYDFFTVNSVTFGSVEGIRKKGGFWTLSHPGIKHDITVKAANMAEALEKAEDWFKTL